MAALDKNLYKSTEGKGPSGFSYNIGLQDAFILILSIVFRKSTNKSIIRLFVS